MELESDDGDDAAGALGAELVDPEASLFVDDAGAVPELLSDVLPPFFGDEA